MQRLDDAEFGRRARERNLRANRQRRERLMSAGYTQWNLWIAGEVRQLAEQLAAQRNQSPSELVTSLVQLAANPALSPLAPVPSSSVESLPLFDTALASECASDRDTRILELHRQGLSNYAIADQVGCSEPTVRRALKRLKQEATG
jgi:DNA-binding NarL/FixJ family response regulator